MHLRLKKYRECHIVKILINIKESKRTHRFSVILSFAPKCSSDRTVWQAKVLSDERLGAKLRVTENQCVLSDSFTYICSALLLQHWALFAKVDSTPTFIYIYVYSCKKVGLHDYGNWDTTWGWCYVLSKIFHS